MRADGSGGHAEPSVVRAAVARYARFARFLATGGVSALVDYGVIIAGTRAGLGSRVAVTLGFLSGLTVNFVMHKYFTFRASQRLKVREVALYGGVVLTNYMVTLGIIEATYGLLGLPLLWAKTLSLPVVAVIGYLLTKHFVFVER